MSFIPLGPCCLKGNILAGEPRGELQKASTTGVSIDRYFVAPKTGTVDPKTALVLFYDVFGFSIPNSKIIADRYADKLGVDVFVPDYIPNPPPGNALEGAVEFYPGENASQGWISAFFHKLSLLKIVTYLPGILDYRVTPLVDKAVADVQAAGYERIVAVGYCRGGSMITHLLSKGNESPLAAACIFHPGFEAKRWPLFTKPSFWLLSEQDSWFKPEGIKQLEETFAANSAAEFKLKVYPNTCHGFGARPATEHKHTQQMFNEANDDAVAYLKEQLGLA